MDKVKQLFGTDAMYYWWIITNFNPDYICDLNCELYFTSRIKLALNINYEELDLYSI